MWLLPPLSLTMRIFNSGSRLNVFFPWLVPCISSLAKWTNYSSPYQIGYWNTNCQNHCPHWLWHHWKLHQHQPPVQSELPPTMSSQTHSSIQRGWNCKHQRNHQMESPHRHPILSVQREHQPYGPQPRLATSDLRNALAVQIEPQDWLVIQHHFHL